MSRAPRPVPGLLLAVVLAAALLAGCTAEPAPDTRGTSDGPASGPLDGFGPYDPAHSVLVDGAVHRPYRINITGVSSIAKEPGPSTEKVTWWGGPGLGTRFEKHTETGLSLVFAEPFDGYDAGPAGTPVQAAVLLVIGADGATAALSYPEVTRRPGSDSVSQSGVLLSYEEDGRELARPRLIVLGDRTGDRAIRDVVEMRVVRLDR